MSPLEHPQSDQHERQRAALALLRDIGGTVAVARWRYAIVAIERTRRISLPDAARHSIGTGATVHAQCRGSTMVLAPSGPGVAVAVDSRGRLALPMWLRSAAQPMGAVVVACLVDTPMVLVTPTSVLDELFDWVAAQER